MTTSDDKDYLGTVSRQTNSSQTTTATRQYDAFGMLVASTGTPQGPFGYAGGWGYQEDTDSGLKLLGHRYYDASTGRFLTRDPVKDGRNWYGYCDNGPDVHTDPNGQQIPGITPMKWQPIKGGVPVIDPLSLGKWIWDRLFKHRKPGPKPPVLVLPGPIGPIIVPSPQPKPGPASGGGAPPPPPNKAPSPGYHWKYYPVAGWVEVPD
jgi:RHS repeat-associated protein